MATRTQIQRLEQLVKKFSIRSYEDWYKLSPQQIRSEIPKEFKFHELLQKAYPSVDWKVYKLKIKPRGFWGTPEFTRQFFLDLLKELDFSKLPEDLYKIQIAHLEKFGGRSLFSIHDSYVDSIIQSFPEYELKPWLFTPAKNKIFWKNKKYQEQFLKEIEKKYEIKEPSDWYRISNSDIDKEGGSALLNYYDRSLFKTLSSIYKDIKWYPWLFPSVPNYFWNDKENQRAFMEYLGNQLNYSNWEGYYNLTHKQFIEHGGAGLLEMKFDNSIHKAVTSILFGDLIQFVNLSEHPWKNWKFTHLPKGFWANKENCLLFFEDLGKQLQIKSLDDWYNFSNIDILHYEGCLQMINYFGTLAKVFTFFVVTQNKALEKVYPEKEWKPWLFKRRVRNLWEDINVCKKAFDWAAVKLQLDGLYEWYYVSKQDLLALGLLNPVELHGGLISLLKKIYPGTSSQFLIILEYEWNEVKDEKFYLPKIHLQLSKQIREVLSLSKQSEK